jgi:hypothetical protein
MNLGQTMISIGMLVLLMMTVISANKVLIDNVETETQMTMLHAASVVATDLLAEMMSKAFDQQVVIDTTAATWRQDTTGIKISSASSLTAYGGAQWGVRSLMSLPDTSSVDAFSSRTTLRDIDDYDYYWRLATKDVDGMSVTYTATSRVYYVNYLTPDDTSAASTRTYFKKIVVTVKQSTYKVDQTYTAMATY